MFFFHITLLKELMIEMTIQFIKVPLTPHSLNLFSKRILNLVKIEKANRLIHYILADL